MPLAEIPAAEPVPEEPSADETMWKWTKVRVPSDAGGWPRPYWHNGTAARAEALPETAPSSADAPAESQSGKDQPERVAHTDSNLYQDWGSLSPKRRATRTRKLKKRGLPVPNEDGLLSQVDKIVNGA